MRRRRRSTIAASVVTAGLLVAAVAMAVLAPTAGVVVFLAVGTAGAVLTVGLGLLVARRQPSSLMALLLTLVGLAVAHTVTKEIAWRVLGTRPGTAASLDWLVAGLNESSWWSVAALVLLLAYFPDGELPSPRWRWVPWTLIGCIAITQIYGAMDVLPSPLEEIPSPFGRPAPWFEAVAFAAFVVQMALILACTVAPAVRYRRADSRRRAQLKWLALAAMAIPLFFLVCFVEIVILGRPLWLSWVLLVAVALGIPVAAAIAILRHDLYDVDKALAGTVTWTLITGGLFGIYAASSLTTGLVLDRGSAAVAAAVTALCALALAPLRVRLQRRVDRNLYPLRRAAFTAVGNLHRDAGAGTAQPEELQSVLRVALRDPALRVGYLVPGTDGFVDADGQAVSAAGGIPIVVGGAQIGLLVPGPAALASAELLRQIGVHATTLIEVVRLRLQLASALHQVESSRARLLEASYAERRRLERDLHDGAQQRLVSLGMSLRVAQNHLDDGSVDVNRVFDESVAELGTAVAELRHLAHGLRPSNLDDGLEPALMNLTRGVPVPVRLDVRTEDLDDSLATTAYYVASEAIANVVKHAQADQIVVSVVQRDGRLELRIQDDGCGGAAVRPGAGLAGLRDRVAALGGSLAVRSTTGRGTLVEAVLPCAS